MFWICMYTLVCTRHTYALKIKSFWWFSCLRNFELNCLISWLCDSHYTCALTSFKCFSWLCFHEYDMGFMDFECLVTMWFTCFSWNIILFYSLLEGFRTSLQIFHITSCGILHYGRVFKHTIFSNLFLKTPTRPRAIGWETMPYMFIIENHF